MEILYKYAFDNYAIVDINVLLKIKDYLPGMRDPIEVLDNCNYFEGKMNIKKIKSWIAYCEFLLSNKKIMEKYRIEGVKYRIEDVMLKSLENSLVCRKKSANLLLDEIIKRNIDLNQLVYNIRYGVKFNPIYTIMSYGNMTIIKKLLDSKFNFNKKIMQDKRPKVYPTFYDHYPATENEYSSLPEVPIEYPLGFALVFNTRDVVELLINNGVRPYLASEVYFCIKREIDDLWKKEDKEYYKKIFE